MRPMPRASGFPRSPASPFTRTSTRKRLRWSGPLSFLTRYTGAPARAACSRSCKRRFIVAQRGSGAQLDGQALGSFAHHLAAHKGPHRLQTAIEIQRAHHCFHGIGEHRALAAQAAALFAAAQAQMLAQADGLRHLRHALAADQAGANAGKLALVPFRMRGIERLGHHQPQHRVARNSRRSLSSLPPAGMLPAASILPAAWMLPSLARARAPGSDG